MDKASFNEVAAKSFRQCAQILGEQKANPFRVSAYVHAAQTLESLDTDVRQILAKDGVAGLIRLPGIGRGLAAAIEELARTGRFLQLDRLRGKTDPEKLFQSVPGIGPTIARAIHEGLHVDTLEALELAAYDGRLHAIPGVGTRRAAAIRAGLSALLGRGGREPRNLKDAPSVACLLDVDREYRERALSGKLTKIAPRRFNPDGRAWLPVLHTDRDGWHFTAMYSNTARAHELSRTRDWVVVYFYDSHHQEGQSTIVTETFGSIRGKRVVRGREAQCRRYYRDR